MENEKLNEEDENLEANLLKLGGPVKSQQAFGFRLITSVYIIK
jgi:hypothetical protein